VKLLLDSCTFLWLAGSGSLSPLAASSIRNPSNEVFLSSVSAWEIASKHRAGKLLLPEPPDHLIRTERELRGVAALAFDEESAFQVFRLPPLHRDPFDRMLISQAIAGGLAIVTPDPLIAQYPVRVIW
jgi:PIN domain nuclease of toxin-antitoxin system